MENISFLTFCYLINKLESIVMIYIFLFNSFFSFVFNYFIDVFQHLDLFIFNKFFLKYVKKEFY